MSNVQQSKVQQSAHPDCFCFSDTKVKLSSSLLNIEPTNAQFFCMNCSIWGDERNPEGTGDLVIRGFGDLGG